MKKLIVYFCLAVAAVLVCGCSKDNSTEKPIKDYEIFHDRRTTTFEDYFTGSIEMAMSGTDPSTITKLLPLLKGLVSEDEVSYYDYTYSSTDPHGLPVRLSARLYVPNSAYSGSQCKGVVLANHYTLMCSTNCPTKLHSLLSAHTWMGYAVVVPDYYGKGESSDRHQLLFESAFNAQGCFDALVSAIGILDDLDISYDGDRIYNYGYSQGGGIAVGVQKIAAQHPEAGINLYKTFAGGSPVDIVDIMKSYQKNKYSDGLHFQSFSLANVIAEQVVDVSYEEVFTAKILPYVDRYFLSGTYEMGELEAIMDGMSYEDVFTPEFLSESGPVADKFAPFLEKAGVAKGWGVPSGTSFYLYTAKEDRVIPKSNFNTLKENLTNYPSLGELYFMEGSASTHRNGAFEFFLWLLASW